MNRQELLTDLYQRLSEQKKRSASIAASQLNELASNGEHSGGEAVDSYIGPMDADVAIAVIQAEQRRINSLNQFGEALLEGRAGKCSECGGNIPKERLEALSATTCVRCQKTLEEGR